jgi:hypothetical protein
VAFGGNFIGAPNHPGIFGGTILAQLREQLLKARVELPFGAVAVKMQRQIVGRRRHNLLDDLWRVQLQYRSFTPL